MSPRTEKQFEEIREQSIKKILDAAMELFAEEGYDRTSMNQIAKKADVSKGLIYNYFPSKEELLKALMLSIMNEVDMSSLTPDAENANPEKIFKNLIDLTFDLIQNHPRKMMLMTKLSLQVSQFDFIQGMIRGKVDFYFGFVQKLFADMGYDDPKSEAYILSLIMDGLSVQALSLKDKFWFDEAKNSIYKNYEL